MFYTYIIYSKSTDKYYIGHTSVGVKRRLKKHNDGWTRSTKTGIPGRLRYYKTFDSKIEAVRWENFIKSQKGRKFIEELISDSENEYNIA